VLDRLPFFTRMQTRVWSAFMALSSTTFRRSRNDHLRVAHAGGAVLASSQRRETLRQRK